MAGIKTKTVEDKYDTCLETSDWRNSASIVGLVKYFDYHNSVGEKINYCIDHDVLKYNSEDITEERYLKFVEYYFNGNMHHIIVEQLLNSDELSGEQVKLLNKKLNANDVMKKIFKGVEFPETSREEILNILNDNRLSIIKETYRQGKKLYANFANPNKLLELKSEPCRILNYYVEDRKTKSISYSFDFGSYEYEDEIEFDFIPFAFSKSDEAFFINNNYAIRELISVNELIKGSLNPRTTLFGKLKNSSNFIDFDIEVIVKDIGSDYFKTLYIRKDAIDILKKIDNYKNIQFKYEISKNYKIDFEKAVTNSILNNLKLDSLIELLFKSGKNYVYSIRTLVQMNILIYGGYNMDKKMRSAYKSAEKVNEEIPKNKVNSYKQKLISAITSKNYDKFNEILLQLSAYSGVVFDFAYDLFENFDENKNLAYTFINTLRKEDGGIKK